LIDSDKISMRLILYHESNQQKNNTNDENNEANKQYKSREILLNMNSSTKEEYDSARKKFSLEKESEQKQISHLKSDSNIGRNIDFTI